MTSLKASSGMSTSSWSLVMPALATTTSTGPCVASATANASSTAVESRTSHLATVRPGTSSPERDVIVTLSPAADSRLAMARPRPRLPPVTRTERPIVHLRWSGARERARVRPRGCKYGRREPSGSPDSGVLEPEAHLHADLEVRYLAAVELTADLGDLEPVQVPQRLGSTAQTVAHGGVDAFRRGADYLGYPVRAVGHRCLQPRN